MSDMCGIEPIVPSALIDLWLVRTGLSTCLDTLLPFRQDISVNRVALKELNVIEQAKACFMMYNENGRAEGPICYYKNSSNSFKSLMT